MPWKELASVVITVIVIVAETIGQSSCKK